MNKSIETLIAHSSTSLLNFQRVFVCAILVCVVQAMFCSTAIAQDRKFDLNKWLTDRDKNKSGTIETDELDDRSKNFLSKMKLDTSKPIVIADVVRKSNSDREAMEEENARKEFARREWEIPGFGEPMASRDVPSFEVDKSEVEAQGKVPGFEISKESVVESSVSIRELYGRKIEDRVNGVFRQYDKNKSGVFEVDEMKTIPWRDPPWKDFDENNDGQLTKIELAKRYVSIEGGNNDNNDRDRDRERRDRRNDNRDSDRRSNNKTTKNKTPSDSKTSSNNKSSSLRAVEYANSQLKSKDKNNNGKIDGEEEMKSIGILKKADSDGNGEITKEELIAFASGSKTSSSSSQSSSQSSTNERKSVRNSGNRRNNRRSSSKSGEDRIIRDGVRPGTQQTPSDRRMPVKDEAIKNRRDKPSSDFKAKDRNQDGMIQLTEFEREITLESIDAFRTLDANGDGVITPNEWQDD